jgi:hypothetical protein
MSKFLSWLPSIVSAIVWLIGQIRAAQANVMLSAGTFSSAESAAETISFWSNVETGGMVATAVTAGIAFLINRFWGKVFTGKLKPHARYQAAAAAKLTLAKYLADDPASVTTLGTLDKPMKAVFAAELEAAESPVVEAK